jgi:hypothetical protein
VAVHTPLQARPVQEAAVCLAPTSAPGTLPALSKCTMSSSITQWCVMSTHCAGAGGVGLHLHQIPADIPQAGDRV